MGYQAYISTETELYSTDDGGITVDNWLEVVQNDPELIIKESIEATNPATGEKIFMPLNNTAIWAEGTPDAILFSHSHGRISMPYPSGRAAEKAKDLAQKLAATLFGEEGETV